MGATDEATQFALNTCWGVSRPCSTRYPSNPKNEAVNGMMNRKSCWSTRLLILLALTGMVFLAACGDPYKQCMKEEKLKNAYLGEEDYLQKSSEFCAKKARLAN